MNDGDYRTKRVILEIYDTMAEAMRTGQLYQTRLDPPRPPRAAAIRAGGLMNEGNGTESMNESEFPNTYYLSVSDRVIVDAAIQLLGKITHAPFTRPAQLASVAKALYVLSKIPHVTQAEVTVHISLNGPRRWFGEHEIWHWWTVEIDNQFIEIGASGHFYRKSTGGDSFTSLIWSAGPGEQATCLDYLDKLWIVDDAQPFPEEIANLDLAEPGFSLEVRDEDNLLLEELEVDDEDLESD